MSCLHDYTHVVPKTPKCNKNWEMSYSFSFDSVTSKPISLCFLHLSEWHRLHPVTLTENLGVVFVIVKFMCQLDWAAVYKVIW